MSLDINNHIGEQLIALTLLNSGSNPDVLAIAAPTVSADLLAGRIHQDIVEVLVSYLGSKFTYASEYHKLRVHVHPRTGIIKPPEERATELSKALAAIGELREEESSLEERLQHHPDNGKSGWWRVHGIRHSCMIKASSALEAVTKAIDQQLVGEWESGEPSYVGTQLPDGFRC